MKHYIEQLKNMFGEWEDFEKIIELQTDLTIRSDFMNIVFSLPETLIINFFYWLESKGNSNLIIENIDNVLQYVSESKMRYRVWIEHLLDYLVEMKNPIINQSISNHLIGILQGPYGQGNLWSIFSICNKYKDVGNARTIIEENYLLILRTVFSDNAYITNNLEILNYILQLLDKVTKKEKLRLSDISFCGEGSDSKCVQVGNYVFKFGKGRILGELFQHKRIIQPLLRQNIPENFEELLEAKAISSDNILAIEIQPLTEKNWYEGLTDIEIEEKLYLIFKKLMDAGIEWTDVKTENVGRMKIFNSENDDGLVIFDTERLFSIDRVPVFEEWQIRDTLYQKFKNRYEIESTTIMKRSK